MVAITTVHCMDSRGNLVRSRRLVSCTRRIGFDRAAWSIWAQKKERFLRIP